MEITMDNDRPEQKKWRTQWKPENEPLGYVAEWITSHQPDDNRVLWVDFTIWSVIASNIDEPDKLLFQRKDSNHSLDTVENTDDAESLVEGFIKWDGCNEIHWGDESVHRCGLKDRERNHDALMLVMRTAVDIFMGDTYTVDEMPNGDVLNPIPSSLFFRDEINKNI